MLKVYHGRENLDKDRFIFDRIKEARMPDGTDAGGRHIFLIVPDQYTLEAERQAFAYLEAKSLMDIEVLSFSRLGSRVLQETGGGRRTFIDRQGRHMLLYKILREHDADLQVYKGFYSNTSFIEMVNDLISEMKQYSTSSGQIAAAAQSVDSEALLSRKLKDISLIFGEYEKHISGRYVDTEDYVTLFADKIGTSEKIRDSIIWIYGFDYFTPRNLEVIERLRQQAAEVNVMLTWDDEGADSDIFAICRRMAEKLKPESISLISDEYADRRNPAVSVIEKQLFALPAEKTDETEGLHLVEAANIYAEAETAASFIRHLARDKGYRYKDIVVICNDTEGRGSVCKRVFGEYDISLFMDAKRDIRHSPAVNFILALLGITGSGYKTEDVFRMLKTGLGGLDRQETEKLEQYATRYRIRGSLWKRPFEKGLEAYGEAGLGQIEELRRRTVTPVEEMAERFREGKTVREKTEALYEALTEVFHIPGKITALMEEQEAAGRLEAAGETAQIWNVTAGIMDQMVEMLGDEKISMEDFAGLFESGFSAVEIGLLPPAADGLMMGTMQRTRSGHVRAMVIIGANDGLLPAVPASEDILSEDEKNILQDMDIEICKMDSLRSMEETLAIYRNLSKAEDQLYISFSASDEEGKAAAPSYIYKKICSIFPDVKTEKDIVSRGDPMALIDARRSTLNHLADRLRESSGGPAPEEEWEKTLMWYREHQPESCRLVRDGLFYDSRPESPGKDLAEAMYRQDPQEPFSFSPSRLESFGRCPFSHFVRYGLRPEEQRAYEIGPIEMGDIYHDCFRLLAGTLTGDMPVTDGTSPWMNVTREECDSIVMDFLEKKKKDYLEGILSSGGEEKYRSGRISELCCQTAWVIVQHVRSGQIETMAFEEPFGRGKAMPPIEVSLPGGDAESIYIEGKIDRVDIMPGGNVKVIDYKSGSDRYDEKEARAGIRLQLMLYLRAASGNGRTPAGTFYFHVKEPLIDAEGIGNNELRQRIAEEVAKTFRMDGIIVDRPEVIESITGGSQDIFSLRSRNRVLSEDDFDQLLDDVCGKVDQMCRDIVQGDISIRPRKMGDVSSCTYCSYRGICRFDLSFEGCRYEKI